MIKHTFLEVGTYVHIIQFKFSVLLIWSQIIFHIFIYCVNIFGHIYINRQNLHRLLEVLFKRIQSSFPKVKEYNLVSNLTFLHLPSSVEVLIALYLRI